MVVSDGLEDWFPHISPDGKKIVYIGYPTGTPTHDPRNVQIEIKLVSDDAFSAGRRVPVANTPAPSIPTVTPEVVVND